MSVLVKSVTRQIFTNSHSNARLMHTSFVLFRKPTPEMLAADAERAKQLQEDPPEYATNEVLRKKHYFRRTHSLETSIRYMESETFQNTYKGLPIWRWYRRNIRGQEIYQPKPRTACTDKYGVYRTNNPCPICKDEYLVLHFRNIELVKIFMIPNTDQPRPILQTGLCMEMQRRLEGAIIKAKDHGLLLFDVPFRVYDYNEYYPWKDWGEMPKIPDKPEPLERSQRKSYIKYPVFLPDKRKLYWPWYEEWDKFAQKSYTTY